MCSILLTVDKSKKVSLLKVVFAWASALLALEPLDVAQSGPVESYGGLAAPIEGTWTLKIYRVTQAITFSALQLAIAIFAPTLATNMEAQDVRLPTMGSVVTRGSNPTIAPRLASLRAKAERGNREAQLLVGAAYEYGLGIDVDYRQAAQWYRKAADQGLPEAQGHIGLLYLTGSGVERDYTAALKWFLRGASQHDVGAQINLSYMYRYGVGVDQDLGEAFRWMLEAADRGIPAADSYLADMYEQGLGVERNFRKALEYYRKAARVHFGPAENGLGVMYFCGEGVRQDFKRSTQWYREAIRDGSDLAKVNLAVAYENGLAVPRDRDEAARLFEDAPARLSSCQVPFLEVVRSCSHQDAERKRRKRFVFAAHS